MLKDVKINLQEELTLFIGKNDTGKTSFIVLLEKFLKTKQIDFNFNDFHTDLRKSILSPSKKTPEADTTIRLGIEIEYDEGDDLSHVSSFIHDLNDDKNTINLLFQARIDRDRLKKNLAGIDEKEKKEQYIKNNLSNFLEKAYYTYENENMFKEYNMDGFIKKELADIRKIINLEVIHAKRNVATSNDTEQRYKVISKLTSDYYNEKNKESEYLDSINESLLYMDTKLESNYEATFKELLETTKEFLSGTEVVVESNLQSESLLKYSSAVTYGTEKENRLPENHKGLGYTNLIYLVLNMEIKLMRLANQKSNINLFIIEEPEAHTHPQLQSIFIKKLKENITKWKEKEALNLQSIVTSHSARIVDHCDFADLRYFRLKEESEIEIADFVKELTQRYKKLYNQSDDNKQQASNENSITPGNAFNFIKQYINIHTSELFFTDKAIIIEGITEGMLLPYFINEVAEKLNSQSYTVLEAGANAKVFHPLLDFLQIKTLIITDIDATKKGLNKDGKHTRFRKNPVDTGTFTSNQTLKYFFDGEKINTDKEREDWFIRLKDYKISQLYSYRIFVVYQKQEKDYHARSFEDAFINLNYDMLKANSADLIGIDTNKLFNEKDSNNLFELTEKVIEKKSDFAASLLYLALSGKVKWDVPGYIKDGLEWLVKM